MTTIQEPHQAATPHPGRAAACTTVTCRCGQELDVCHGEHCPRCGTAVHRDADRRAAR
jgi:hypothetical protein